MNAFEGIEGLEASAEMAADFLPDLREATLESRKEATGPPKAQEGKASRESRRAKYIRVSAAVESAIRLQLRSMYGNAKNGVATEIVVPVGDTVFVVDSGNENGNIDFAVRKKKIISDEEYKHEYIRERNYDALSKGLVSEELSSRFRSWVGRNSGRDVRRELRTELSTDKGKPADNQSGVLGENADKRGLKGKASVDLFEEMDADYLSAVERGDMETAQRMVDEAAKRAGYTRLFYHGAKKGGGFTVFRDWSYFTENKAYAERYADREKSGSLYTTYVKLDKPFDTRKAADRRLFNEIRQEYGLSEIQASGLPDWTDGYDISDYVDENDLDYDGIILDEGGDMVEGKPVSRGESYVVRKSAQIKSADPVTYDDNGNVIPLSERFNSENADIRFSQDLFEDMDEGDVETDTEATERELSPREQLAAMLESDDMSPAQKGMLTKYKNKLSKIEANEAEIASLGEELDTLKKSGKGNTAKADVLRKKIRDLEKLNAVSEGIILNLEATKPIKRLLERERKAAYQEGLLAGHMAQLN